MATTSKGGRRLRSAEEKRSPARSLDQALADARREADAGMLVPEEEANRIIDAMPTEAKHRRRHRR